MIFQTNTVTNRLLYCTTRIEVKRSNGTVGTGTGFFLDFHAPDGQILPTIVTNKHVVRGATTGSFQVHLSDQDGENRQPSGRFETISLPSFESRWIHHPDPDVDLCAMPIQPLRTRAASLGVVLYWLPLQTNLFPDDNTLANLQAVEDILMVGYPVGLWDDANNFPIVRRGATATHPAVDFKGSPIGAIDAASFPGSSGSPVLIVNDGTSFRTGNTINMGGHRTLLLGVLFGGPMYGAEGEIAVKSIPTTHAISTRSEVPIHVGFYVKARELLTLGEHMVDVLLN